jgi:hypothetical protein
VQKVTDPWCSRLPVVAEQKAAATARKLIPDVADRTAITNPLETLLELASEANAFRESLRIMANELDGKIRYAAGGGPVSSSAPRSPPTGRRSRTPPTCSSRSPASTSRRCSPASSPARSR